MAITPNEAEKQALLRLPMEQIVPILDKMIVAAYQRGEAIVMKQDFLAGLRQETANSFEPWWWEKIAQVYRNAGWSVVVSPDGIVFKTPTARNSYFPDDK